MNNKQKQFIFIVIFILVTTISISIFLFSKKQQPYPNDSTPLAEIKNNSGCDTKETANVNGVNLDYGLEDFTYEIAKKFYEGNFKSIIESSKIWSEKNCTLVNGLYKKDYMLAVFTKYFKRNDNWGKSLMQIEKFKAAYPNNSLPVLAEARYWSDYANDARGFGYASTVTEDGWKLFKERLEKSEAILLNLKNKPIDSLPPLWYSQMIRVENLLGRSSESINAIFEEGIKKYKNELPIYMEMSYYLEPRWGGNWSDVDKIILLAEKNVTNLPSDIVYTKLYWEHGDLMYSDKDFFSETKVSWDKMRAGFTKLLQQYPHSSLIANNFLAYSCLAKDKTTYKKYRELTPIFDIRAWRSENARDVCDKTIGYNP